MLFILIFIVDLIISLDVEVSKVYCNPPLGWSYNLPDTVLNSTTIYYSAQWGGVSLYNSGVELSSLRYSSKQYNYIL